MLTKNVVPDFTSLNVAVVGDLIADHYHYTEPTRLSREAPVMVLRHQDEEMRGGGAANVARNLWEFGAATQVIGAVGRDSNGRDLLAMLRGEGIDVSGVETVAGWVTPTKTRIMGADPRRTMQQLLRIDREPDAPLAPEARRKIADRVRSLGGEADVIILSDYTYGVVGEELADAAREAKAAGTRVILDPRHEIDAFHGLTAITPNLAELADLTGHRESELRERGQVIEAARDLMQRVRPDYLLVTLGNQGMSLFSEDLPPDGLWVEASGLGEVIDVSGAGDTAVSAFALGLAAGLEVDRAMRISNAASGVVVMESGTASCSLSKLRSCLPHAPIPAGFQAVAP